MHTHILLFGSKFHIILAMYVQMLDICIENIEKKSKKSKISKISDIFDIFENITIFSNPACRQFRRHSWNVDINVPVTACPTVSRTLLKCIVIYILSAKSTKHVTLTKTVSPRRLASERPICPSARTIASTSVGTTWLLPLTTSVRSSSTHASKFLTVTLQL